MGYKKPEGFTLVPDMPEDKYYMDRKGQLYNINNGRILRPGVPKRYAIGYTMIFGKKRFHHTAKSIYKHVFREEMPNNILDDLLEILGKEIPTRIEDDEDFTPVPRAPKRKCHDCKCPTYEYRCRKCQAEFLQKNGVNSEDYEGELYGAMCVW
jgi:hypothetical protein